MLKKSFITALIFCLIAFLSTTVFASNLMDGAESSLNNIKEGVQNMAGGMRNVAEDAKNRNGKSRK